MRKCGLPNLEQKAKELIALLAVNPFENPPPAKKLAGQLSGLWARRINKQHRLVYRIDSDRRAVIIVSIWTHYGN